MTGQLENLPRQYWPARPEESLLESHASTVRQDPKSRERRPPGGINTDLEI